MIDVFDKRGMADSVWRSALADVVGFGDKSRPRGMEISELIGYQSVVDMNYPIVTNRARKLGYRFMPAEAAWILSGDNRVETIAPYAPAIKRFSDDGMFYAGAYGPVLCDQLAGVCAKLLADLDTRQAVATIWRPNLRDTKDCPCTVAVQWVVRDGFIHCLDTMRSSDLWLGWPYDVFNFTMITGYIVLILKAMGLRKKLKLGSLVLTAGSQHLYASNMAAARECLAEPWERKDAGEAPYRSYHPFDPYEFRSPSELVDHLRQLADGNSMFIKHRFGKEMLLWQGG